MPQLRVQLLIIQTPIAAMAANTKGPYTQTARCPLRTSSLICSVNPTNPNPSAATTTPQRISSVTISGMFILQTICAEAGQHRRRLARYLNPNHCPACKSSRNMLQSSSFLIGNGLAGFLQCVAVFTRHISTPSKLTSRLRGYSTFDRQDRQQVFHQ